MFKKKKFDVKDKKFEKRDPVVIKECVFCKNVLDIDYKNTELLSRYVSQRGKILSRRISGNCAKHQRKVCKEVKRARFLNLSPYVGG
ncbi:MAG: 30S ribosomal protein S18 [Candidatus Omnitrophica bacterium]|nr:30S ribosomal protein S18 [Candidatus Omnitrophota bacterium]MCK5287854.1 30S ribosomal protein S18 [Candidatus Omnitrophota bacterium]MCK5393699.1 30S ribosomal protein S18 [Candidatus Omnitrophota bacterium]